MKARANRRSNGETMLISVAESIGSTLGTIAAKAGSAQDALSRSSFLNQLERESKKLVRKSKGVARSAKKATNNAARNVKRKSTAKTARRSVRRARSK